MNHSIDVEIEFECMINSNTKVTDMSYSENWITVDEILIVIYYAVNG